MSAVPSRKKTGAGELARGAAKSAEAERKAAIAAVLLRHKAEWEKQRELSDRAMSEEDADLAKLAKLTAETLKIRQEGERKAWGINDKAETEVSGGVVLTWQK